jgi:Rieske Fe-S protein
MSVVTRKDPFPVSAPAEHALDRRRLLCGIGAAAVAMAMAEWAARLAPAGPAPAPVVLSGNALAVGEARAVATASGVEALAVRLDAGTIVAFDRRCPHLGCPVVWAAARDRFECPCHHAAFEARTGRVVTGPPARGLAPVAVELA